jgi:hypothetical protein
MNSTLSTHPALLLGTPKLPPAVLRTRSSSGMSWDLATVAHLVAGARISQVRRKRRLVPVTAMTTTTASAAAKPPTPDSVAAAFAEASADALICMAAALAAHPGPKNNSMQGLLTGAKSSLAKQVEAANVMASEAAKTQAAAQKQSQINQLTIAIKIVAALLEHELMVFDFAGALVIGIILIDLNNQLAQLLGS